MKALILAALLLPLSAFAQVPLLASGARVHDGPAVYLLGGTEAFGAGAGVGFWSAELGVRPWASALSVRAARSWQLVDGLFSVSAQLGGALQSTLAGPYDLGVGPHAGVSAGIGSPIIDVFLLAQAGAEVFARTGGPRFPIRGGLGFAAELGSVRFGVIARTGADLEPSRAFTLRYELAASLGWHL